VADNVQLRLALPGSASAGIFAHPFPFMREFISAQSRQIINVLMTLGALGGLAAIAPFMPRFVRPILHRGWCALGRIARSEWRAVAIVAAFSLGLCILTRVVSGPAIPKLHDEFSYLLAGDTFAHGRLTNPPLPDETWLFFETMHELVRPTYASKFGPAQGLFLALGQVLTGQPLVGVWISTVLGCAALTWALYGWIRPRWALLGGLVTAIHPHIIYWCHTYWGGTVGMLGGALVFGSIARIMSRRRRIDAATLVIGLAIVANSRPYEAMLWGIAIGATLLGGLFRACRVGWASPTALRCALVGVVAPALIVGLPIVAWMGYYNFRVTGQATRLPYQLHSEQYMAVPLFYWSPPPPPKVYRHEALRHHFDVYERWYFESRRDPSGWAWYFGSKIYTFWEQFLLRSLLLSAGFLAMPWALARRDWRMRLCAFYFAIFAIGWAIIPWFEHHYPAPLMAVIALLGISGARIINGWRWRGAGRMFVRLCVISTLVVLPIVLRHEYANNHGGGWWIQRSQMLARLQSEGGKHLIIVRYGPDHVSGNEWVFNAADINAAPVIWAREMSPAEMPKLIDHFKDRRTWLLDVEQDGRAPTLTAYPK